MGVNDDATGWGDAIRTKRWSPWSKWGVSNSW